MDIVAYEVHPRGMHPDIKFFNLKTQEEMTFPDGVMVVVPKDYIPVNKED